MKNTHSFCPATEDHAKLSVLHPSTRRLTMTVSGVSYRSTTYTLSLKKRRLKQKLCLSQGRIRIPALLASLGPTMRRPHTQLRIWPDMRTDLQRHHLPYNGTAFKCKTTRSSLLPIFTTTFKRYTGEDDNTPLTVGVNKKDKARWDPNRS